MSAAQTRVNNSGSMYRWVAGGLGAVLIVTLVFLLGMAQSTEEKVDNHETRISTIEGAQKSEHKDIERRLGQIEIKQDKVLELLAGGKNAKR